MVILSVMHTYDLTLRFDLLGNRKKKTDEQQKKNQLY